MSAGAKPPAAPPPNIYDPVFDEPREEEGFRARRARLGYQMASERLGLSLWEVPVGEAAYPYHFHLTEEEIVIVLEGEPVLRAPEGPRQLGPGDVIGFQPGEPGAHQFTNPGPDLVRLLSMSTHGVPDLVVYPDSKKLGAAERHSRGGGLRLFFRIEDAVDYWDRESPPSSEDER
ncbi:MAG: hypothetical protein QOE28_2403 [Solirubrobacteraceae bacterium]|jgi:uncharacterized cupin superfamily protein|nr:hypothetical protein [Solirubrobacteraceae bacterium]